MNHKIIGIRQQAKYLLKLAGCYLFLIACKEKIHFSCCESGIEFK